MEQFLYYLCQSALVLSVLFVPFQLLLRKEYYYALNRVILLAIMVMSLLLPMGMHTLPSVLDAWLHTPPEATKAGTIELEGAMLSDAKKITENTTWIEAHWRSLLVGLWALGALLSLAWMARGIVRFWSFLRSQDIISERLPEGNMLYLTSSAIPSFSWMHSIVMSSDDYAENGDTILAHERAHISHRHSCDKLLLLVVMCIQWWNPFAWLLADSLSQVHEYEADLAVIRQGINATQYQLLLIRKAAGPAGLAMVNGFKHNKLKLRIFMMNNKTNLRGAKVRYLALLPMLLLTVAFTARSEERVMEPSIAAQDDDVTEVCDQQPIFPGGEQALMQFLVKNLHYPKECADQDIQGRVILSFVIEKDGSVSNVEEVKSPDARLTEEAIRVVYSMPKWEPGKSGGQPVRVRYVLPFSFRTNENVKTVTSIEIPENAVLQTVPDVLWLVDDKPMPYEEVKNIKPESIVSMDVLKSEASVKQFVDQYPQAKNGVIIITTKK